MKRKATFFSNTEQTEWNISSQDAHGFGSSHGLPKICSLFHGTELSLDTNVKSKKNETD